MVRSSLYLHGGHLGDGRKDEHVAAPDEEISPDEPRRATIQEPEERRPVFSASRDRDFLIRIGTAYMRAISQVLISVQAKPRVEMKRKFLCQEVVSREEREEKHSRPGSPHVEHLRTPQHPHLLLVGLGSPQLGEAPHLEAIAVSGARALDDVEFLILGHDEVLV